MASQEDELDCLAEDYRNQPGVMFRRHARKYDYRKENNPRDTMVDDHGFRAFFGRVSASTSTSTTTTTTTNENNSTDEKEAFAKMAMKYTEYYYQWKAQAEAQEKHLQRSLSLSSYDRSEAQKQIDWFKYWADLSSRAAHYYFHSNSDSELLFQLPPAPHASRAEQEHWQHQYS
ncbi:expressed unknown protein [Seminavis robusta]|uniref:Uncharacterized protein n=1 Tax=Seminavis robusta TaxID=568900 RepID=A0A9N8DEJ1_9STRA|nr:expressed unknown protein [Seminavis robusta]|eukprot:Sro52_g031021.1  (174) ;mRNA; r:78090-78611